MPQSLLWEGSQMQKFVSCVPLLEERIYTGSEIAIAFFPTDKIELKLAQEDDTYVIQFTAPWGNVYGLGSYTTEKRARKQFVHFQELLQQKHLIHILSPYRAEIIHPTILQKFLNIFRRS